MQVSGAMASHQWRTHVEELQLVLEIENEKNKNVNTQNHNTGMKDPHHLMKKNMKVKGRRNALNTSLDAIKGINRNIGRLWGSWDTTHPASAGK